jgi:hypothetical protein
MDATGVATAQQPWLSHPSLKKTPTCLRKVLQRKKCQPSEKRYATCMRGQKNWESAANFADSKQENIH